MAITVYHRPSGATVGQAAFDAGVGQWQQYEAGMATDRNRVAQQQQMQQQRLTAEQQMQRDQLAARLKMQDQAAITQAKLEQQRFQNDLTRLGVAGEQRAFLERQHDQMLQERLKQQREEMLGLHQDKLAANDEAARAQREQARQTIMQSEALSPAEKEEALRQLDMAAIPEKLRPQRKQQGQPMEEWVKENVWQLPDGSGYWTRKPDGTPMFVQDKMQLEKVKIAADQDKQKLDALKAAQKTDQTTQMAKDRTRAAEIKQRNDMVMELYLGSFNKEKGTFAISLEEAAEKIDAFLFLGRTPAAGPEPVSDAPAALSPAARAGATAMGINMGQPQGRPLPMQIIQDVIRNNPNSPDRVREWLDTPQGKAEVARMNRDEQRELVLLLQSQGILK